MEKTLSVKRSSLLRSIMSYEWKNVFTTRSHCSRKSFMPGPQPQNFLRQQSKLERFITLTFFRPTPIFPIKAAA